MNLLCRAGLHTWKVLRVNDQRCGWLGIFDPLAGVDADCERCGKRHRDYDWQMSGK